MKILDEFESQTKSNHIEILKPFCYTKNQLVEGNLIKQVKKTADKMSLEMSYEK